MNVILDNLNVRNISTIALFESINGGFYGFYFDF